jgi:hypothetical protein
VTHPFRRCAIRAKAIPGRSRGPRQARSIGDQTDARDRRGSARTTTATTSTTTAAPTTVIPGDRLAQDQPAKRDPGDRFN